MAEENKFKTYRKIWAMDHKESEGILDNKSHDICIQEKVDAANCRWLVKDGRIIFGSHNCSIGDSTTEIGGNWKRWTEYVKKMFAENPEGFKEGYIYFGEAMLKHSINYDWDKHPAVIPFDIYSFKKENYLKPREAEKMFKEMGMTFVPILWEGKVKDMPEINEEYIPMSKFGTVKAEGVVIKNITTDEYCKFVSTKFKEVNKNAFGGGRKHAKDDTERLVLIYCTNPRIDKAVFKLLDEGNKLELQLMKKLPHAVMDDIIEEHAKEICRTGYSVNFRDFKKQVTRRCFAVLNQIITNSELNK